MKTRFTKRLTAALMLSLIPAVLLTDAKAGFVADYAIGKLVAMSELGLTKIISGVDESCGDDKVSSFVETWIFPDAGGAQSLERIEALCEEILDRLDELEDEIREETSKIEEMIAETTAEAAIKDLNDAWTSQVDNQIPNDVAAAVEAYQAYFRAASQYGITPTKANKEAVDAAWTKLREAFVDVYQAKTGSYNPRQTDLGKAMTTAAANNRLRDCIAGLTRQLNPANSYNVADYAAMAAYKCLLYSTISST